MTDHPNDEKVVSVRLPRALAEELERAARAELTTRGQIIRRALHSIYSTTATAPAQ